MSFRARIRCSATTHSTLIAMLMLCVIQLSVIDDARAHDPSQHGFAMVVFERPFPAPEFSIQDLDGKLRTLSSYSGQYVLLNFWATWCPPCLAEMPSMERLHQRFSDRQFTVVAASSDETGAAAVRPFIEKLGVTFAVLLDVKKEMAGVYGARDLPLSFLINPQGQVIAAAKGARDWASKQAIEVIGELIAK